MATQTPQLDVARRLADMQHSDFVIRLEAVRTLTAARVDTAEVIRAFKLAAETDASPYVREAALNALKAMGVGVGGLKAYVAPRVVEPPLTSREKIKALAAGFFGWNVIAGVLGLLTNWVVQLVAGQLFLLMWLPVSLIVLIGLLLKRRWVGLGMLAALALNVALIGWLTAGAIFEQNLDLSVALAYFTPVWAFFFLN